MARQSIQMDVSVESVELLKEALEALMINRAEKVPLYENVKDNEMAQHCVGQYHHAKALLNKMKEGRSFVGTSV